MMEPRMSQASENSRDAFQEVKAKADLVEYVEHVTGTTGKRSGKSVFFNPCPFCGHKDCFTVFERGGQQGYRCHSCETHGDVFTFAEGRAGAQSKGESLHAVARFAGVALPEKLGAAPATPKAENRQQKVLEAAIAHYCAELTKRPDVLEWLTAPKPAGRGHSTKTIETMEIGCADGCLAAALQAQGLPLEDIKAAGLYIERKNHPGEWRDFFGAGLVIFPHRLPTGEVAHFTIKDPKKQVDYQLRAENRLDGFLFGNQKAIRHDTVIVVEGENDLASFFDAGCFNVLATLGSLSDEQIRWLNAHASGKTFIFWFDYDTKWGENGQAPAGWRYTRKLYQHLLRNPACQVRVASGLMDPGEDPDDWIQKDLAGAGKRIQAAVKKANNPLLWELRVMPADIKIDADACLRYLQEIDFFEYMGVLPELQRDAVIVEMQKLGFSRDGVMGGIKESYGLKEQLDAVLDAFNGSTRSDGYKRTCAAAVWDYFKSRGRFFVSGDRLCLFYRHTIYQIGDNVPFKALLHREAGLNIKQEVSGFVHEELKALTYSRGDRLSEFGWISLFTDETGPTLYLNLKDPANRIVKISAGSVDIAENGTNAHNVLLAESTQMKPFRYDPEVNVAGAMRDLRGLVLDNLACEPAQRYLLLAWALSAFLLPLTTSRALMKMEGGSGSGKTTAAKLLSLVLYGENMVGRSTTASDYSMAATEPLIIKDNLETDDINRNALNFLLLAATGATNIKREQGTQSGVVAEKINALVAITAIEPFAKQELINRTFTIEFAEGWQRSEFVDSDAEQVLTARRDDIVSAWLHVLAERVVPDLAERGKIIAYIREQHKDFAKKRVAEFLALLVLIARALLRYMPLGADMKLDAGGRLPEYVLLDAWIKYQNEHSRQIEQGTNAVLQLLEGLRRVFLIDFSRKEVIPMADAGHYGENREKIWCELMGVEVYRETLDGADLQRKQATFYFECSTADLLAILNRYGREHGVKVPFQNAKQLGVRITNEMAVLTRAGWEARQVRKVHGSRISRWQWTEPEQDVSGE